jgi:hypothetical protein
MKRSFGWFSFIPKAFGINEKLGIPSVLRVLNESSKAG